MNDSTDITEGLDDLDRRAATAVAALDRAVDATPIPERPDTGTGTGIVADARRWSIPPIALAAGLLVIALVGAGLLFTGGDDETTIAGEVDFTRLALPDPGALGYRIEAVFDSSAGDGGPADPESRMPATVQGPTGDEDPWAEAIVSYSLPSEITTLDGEPVDIGGPEAYFSDDGVAAVGWIDGDETRYLRSTRIDRDQLVAAASEAVSGGGDASAAIPGQRVLYTGTLADVFPSTITVGRGDDLGSSPRAIVAYSNASGSGERLVGVATTRGSEEDLRAGNVLADTTRKVTVRGRDALLAEFYGGEPSGLLHVSWLESDGTLVRADALLIDADTLLEHLDQLEAVSPAAFTALAEDVPPEAGSDTGMVRVNDVLASVEIGEGDVVFAGRLIRSEDGDLQLEVAVDRPDSGDATGTPVASLDEPITLRRDLDDGRTLVAGLIGPSADGMVDVSFPNSDVFDDSLVGPTTATIEGSQSLLFLVIVPEALDPDGGQVLTTAPDGGEITLPL